MQPSESRALQGVHIDRSQVGVVGDHAHVDSMQFNVFQHARRGPVDEAALAAARERLEVLPLDWVPPVAALPPGSRMPLSRKPLFVGREGDLQALADAFKGGTTAAIGQIAAATRLGWGAGVQGCGGLGADGVLVH